MKPGITDLETKEGNKITDDKEKAEELNNFFVSVFTKENTQNILILAKTAEVVPIFKKGKKSDPNNYRPVNLTSTVCKLVDSNSI